MSILALTSDTLIGTPATGNIEYNGQFFGTDSNASRAQLQRIVRATAVASTSGVSVDFNSIPSWTKRITVMFSGVSTNGTSIVQIQIGAGSVTTSGYLCSAIGTGDSPSNFTSGFGTQTSGNAAHIRQGSLCIKNITGNTWVADGLIALSNTAQVYSSGGSLALGGTLDRVRITTINGTDAFDAGTINIIYEG